MKRLLIAGILAGLSFIPRTGSAQSIVLPTTLSRDGIFRASAENPQWINLADCLADDVLHFDVTLTGFAGYTLEVWASAVGVDCTPTAQRTPGGAGDCWLVQRMAATSQITDVAVRAQDVVGRLLPSADTSDVPHAGAESCASPLAMETFLMFMLTRGKTIFGAPQIWKATGFDTDPPRAPDMLDVEAGRGALHLSWTGTPSSDVLGFEVSCERPPENPTPLEVLDDVCQSDLLPGMQADTRYWCSSLRGANTKTATVTGLANDELYAVAVSAVDRVGNTSVLSPVACATPVDEPPNPPKIPRESASGCRAVAQRGSLHVVWLLAGLGVLVARRHRARSTMASASISRSHSGSMNPATCTTVQAGRMLPKASPCTRATEDQSSRLTK